MSRTLIIVAALSMATACGTSTKPVVAPLTDLVHVANCVGPAMSLADSLAAALPPRSGRMIPDDHWADLAAAVPGGFAGVFYDAGKPIVMLTQPSLAEAAKRALAGRIAGFSVETATVRQARWDFAQLVNWYNYLFPRLAAPRGLVSGDKDEVLNRLHFGVIDNDARDRLAETLRQLNVPCDLVVISITAPARIA